MKARKLTEQVFFFFFLFFFFFCFRKKWGMCLRDGLGVGDERVWNDNDDGVTSEGGPGDWTGAATFSFELNSDDGTKGKGQKTRQRGEKNSSAGSALWAVGQRCGKILNGGGNCFWCSHSPSVRFWRFTL